MRCYRWVKMIEMKLSDIEKRVKENAAEKEQMVDKFVKQLERRGLKKGRVRPRDETEQRILDMFELREKMREINKDIPILETDENGAIKLDMDNAGHREWYTDEALSEVDKIESGELPRESAREFLEESRNK